jgi:hypothetical protein
MDEKPKPKQEEEPVRKLSFNSEQEQKQFDEFIKKTNEEHMEPKFSEEVKS